jgi:hypothetical protein
VFPQVRFQQLCDVVLQPLLTVVQSGSLGIWDR